MRAYVLKRYGKPGVASLEEVSEPTPAASQLLVRVRAAGLNPVDFKTRDGKLRALTKLALPIVLGNELAGDVIGVGSGVTGFAVGDRIYARVAKQTLGAFAPVAAVDAALAACMPASLDYVTAAAMPLAGTTALQALRDELALKRGQKLFISGGAGGVGTFAVQLGKWLGAEVATTASPRGEALVRSLGVDRIIDYTRENFEDVLQGYDAGFDLIGGETLTKMFSILKQGGRIVSVAGIPDPQLALKDLGGRYGLAAVLWLASFGVRRRAARAGATYRYLFMRPSGADLVTLATLVDEGRLRVVVDRTFPLDRIAEAFAFIEKGGAKGKVVVEMG